MLIIIVGFCLMGPLFHVCTGHVLPTIVVFPPTDSRPWNGRWVSHLCCSRNMVTSL